MNRFSGPALFVLMLGLSIPVMPAAADAGDLQAVLTELRQLREELARTRADLDQARNDLQQLKASGLDESRQSLLRAWTREKTAVENDRRALDQQRALLEQDRSALRDTVRIASDRVEKALEAEQAQAAAPVANTPPQSGRVRSPGHSYGYSFYSGPIYVYPRSWYPIYRPPVVLPPVYPSPYNGRYMHPHPYHPWPGAASSFHSDPAVQIHYRDKNLSIRAGF